MKTRFSLLFMMVIAANPSPWAWAGTSDIIRCHDLFESILLPVSKGDEFPRAFLDRFEPKIFFSKSMKGTEDILPAKRVREPVVLNESPVVVAQVPQSAVARIRVRNQRDEEVTIDRAIIPDGIGLIAPYESGMKIHIVLRNGEQVSLKLRNFLEFWPSGVHKAAWAFYFRQISKISGSFLGAGISFSASALTALRLSDLQEIEIGMPDGTILSVPIAPGKPNPTLPAFKLDEIESITYQASGLRFTYDIQDHGRLAY